MGFTKGKTPHGAKPFQKGQSGNPDGRPPKLVSHINHDLKEQGYHPVSNTDVKDAFLTLMNLPMAKIAEVQKDSDAPALYRIAAKELLGGKGAEYIEKALDRSLGKAKQELGVTDKNGDDVPLIGAIRIIKPEA